MSSWFQPIADKLFGGVSKNAAGAPPGSPAGEPGVRRRVTVGLDFGTSTSKCCFREEVERKPFYFVAFDGHAGSTPSPLFPSTINFDGKSLFFGPAATGRAQWSSFTSFKMCLLCQAQNDQRLNAAEKCPRCLRDRPGYFKAGEHVVSAEDLCTLHLAVLLSEVLPRIPSSIGANSAQLRLQLNAAGPLDQVTEFGPVGEYFDRVMFYSMKLAETGEPRRAWDLVQALDALSRVRRQHLVPPVEQSPTRVFPETHAACLGYMLLPQCNKGLYGMVDIGAGTTDVSFFWLQKDKDQTAAWYYAAGTKRLGMDNLDLAIASDLGVSPERLRQAREALAPKALAALAPRYSHVKSELGRHYLEIFNQATQLDQRDRAWCTDGIAQFQLFLVGGGASCHPLVDRLSSDPPIGTAWRTVPSRLGVPKDSQVSMSGRGVCTLADGDSRITGLLLLAYGLAHPRPDIPKHFRDLEGVDRVERPTQGFTPEQLYGHT